MTLALRVPDEQGTFARTWRANTTQMKLPEVVVERAKKGSMQAPLLREIRDTDGTRYAVLDCIVEVPGEEACSWDQVETVLGFDWGVRTLVTASVLDLDGHQVGRPFFLDTGPFDGRQARTRRQIDQLKAKVERLLELCSRFPKDDPRRIPSEQAIPRLEREIARCWRKYTARNLDLAHLAANVLLVLATAFGSQIIAGESLKTMRIGRTRQRSQRTLAQLEKQFSGKGRVVAYPEIQMSPHRYETRMAAASTYLAHLSSVWAAREHLCIAVAAHHRERLGSVVVLLQPRLSLEWL
jgi:hypothetical protein